MESDIYKVAEKFLYQLETAEKERDFEKYTSNFSRRMIDTFTKEMFLKELDEMAEEMGEYKERHFMCSLNDFKPHCTRFVWKVIFEKGETIVIIGIFAENGLYKINEHYYY